MRGRLWGGGDFPHLRQRLRMADTDRAPLGPQNGNTNVGSQSTVKFDGVGAASTRANRGPPAPRGLNVVPSFSVLSSGISLEVAAEELILKGARKKPVGGQTMETFYKSITHLHFANQRLLGDVAAITLCSNLRVLYVYENRLTTLRGLGALQNLTHLYAQENLIETLDDFEAPPNLLQLHLTGNRLTTIGGLEQCVALQELHVGHQKVGASAPRGRREPVKGDADTDGGDGDDSSEGGRTGSPTAAASEDEAPPLNIEPSSLMAIAPTLQKLVASRSRLDDDALEPMIVLQQLIHLDLRNNGLESIARLQQFLLRMPCLTALHLSGNPLTEAPKTRERLIVAAPMLAEVDGKPIKPNERAFLQNLAHRQGSASSGGGADGSRNRWERISAMVGRCAGSPRRHHFARCLHALTSSGLASVHDARICGMLAAAVSAVTA